MDSFFHATIFTSFLRICWLVWIWKFVIWEVPFMDFVLAGIVGVAVLGFLVYTLLYPEKF
ncbi:MAG: potassium-transporting ATPase subunit F [Bdellovibrio sp.]|nr:potassium-transporting ATPase subunit F [Bdellovibrio sp.]